MKKTILLVEDEAELRFFLKTALEKEGFEIKEAIDTKEALEKIKEKLPDLILLDILLPGENGFEFLRKIKNDPNLESIPVLILSNYGERESIERGLQLGAKDYLIKANLTLEDIVEKVKSALEP